MDEPIGIELRIPRHAHEKLLELVEETGHDYDSLVKEFIDYGLGKLVKEREQSESQDGKAMPSHRTRRPG